MAYDILIKSGTVFSGTGDPATVVDVGIKDDAIAALGAIDGTHAKTVIDAAGKYVVPGFVDITNHSDTHLTLFQYPEMESLLMQGITTMIGGNCGASLAPLASSDAIGAIRKWADPAALNTNWATVDEYLSQVERVRPGVNYGTFLGYATLRRGVIGNESRLLSPEEKEKVKFLLREGIQEGAFGLSLGLSYGHERVSTTEELIDIARTVGVAGGIVKIHLRSEGSALLASVNEALRIAREANVLVHISHLKAIGKKSWSSLPKVLEIIERASASGVRIHFDVSPYRTTGSLLYLLIPAWAREGGFPELFRRIDTPSEKKKIMDALRTFTLHYENILIVSAKFKSIVGHTLAEIAEHMNLFPEEALLEILRANDGRVKIMGRTVSLRNTEVELKHPQACVASDGVGYNQGALNEGYLVHPRCFGAFPRFWHHFVVEKRLVSREEGIRRMTSCPAAQVGMRKRGIIQKGNFADIVVFDPNLFSDRATHRNPFRFPAGMEWVLVNGKIVVEHGRVTGVRAGRALRHGS